MSENALDKLAKMLAEGEDVQQAEDSNFPEDAPDMYHADDPSHPAELDRLVECMLTEGAVTAIIGALKCYRMEEEPQGTHGDFIDDLIEYFEHYPPMGQIEAWLDKIASGFKLRGVSVKGLGLPGVNVA